MIPIIVGSTNGTAQLPASLPEHESVQTSPLEGKVGSEREEKSQRIYDVVFPTSVSAAAVSSASTLSSIQNSPLFPKLTDQERGLFSALFSRWPLCSSFTLHDLFMMDLIDQWEEVIKTIPAENRDFFTDYRAEFFVNFYLAHLYLSQSIGLNRYNREALLANFHPDFFKKPEEFVTYLADFLQGLRAVTNAIAERCLVRSGDKSKKAQELLRNKQSLIDKSIEQLEQKMTLLSHFYNMDHPERLLVEQTLSSVSEGQELDAPNAKRLECALKVSSLLKDFLKMIQGKWAIAIPLSPFDRFFQLIEKTGVHKNEASKFNREYGKHSIEFLHWRGKFERYLDKALNASLTHEEYCQENQIVRVHHRDQRGFIAFMLHVNFSINLIDQWVNNLNETLGSHFLEKLGGAAYRPPKEYIHRLLKNLHSVDVETLSRKTPRVEENGVLNQFAQQVFKGLEAPYKEMHRVLSQLPVPFSRLAQGLEEVFNQPHFQLSLCQAILAPVYPQFSSLDRILGQLDLLHQEHLKTIKGVSLDDLPLKEEMQRILFEQAQDLSAFIMILQDIRIILQNGDLNDFIHLLPTPVIRYLEIDGFDEAVSKIKPDPVSAPFAPPAASSSAEPPTRPSAASVGAASSSAAGATSSSVTEFFSKQDFLNAKKRSVIIQMLKQMGFHYERSGKGSHEVYRHAIRKDLQPVVPHHIDAAGTRKSIYNQATGK